MKKIYVLFIMMVILMNISCKDNKKDNGNSNKNDMKTEEIKDYSFLTETKWLAIYGIQIKEVIINKVELNSEDIVYKSKYESNLYLLDKKVGDKIQPIGGTKLFTLMYSKDKNTILLKDPVEDLSLIYSRYGNIVDEDDLFLGKWGDSENEYTFEVKLVKPDSYKYFIMIPEIFYTEPDYPNQLASGWHLLKQVDEKTFESDETFGGDKITLTIYSKERMYVSQEGAEGLTIEPVLKYFKDDKIPSEEELEKELRGE